MTYIMENIPAFKEESYMLAAKNYKAAMYFELKEYYNFRGKKQLVTKEWENVDRELLTDKRFGGQISNEAPFRDILPPLTADLSSAEKKARAIYDYIRKNVRWNKHYGKYSQVGIKELLAKRSGNTGDINLALIAALRAADIECHPVILSTRENGLPNDLHPVISGFNYVIAAVKIDNELYYLDATEQYLPFGELPLRCINGNGRIIYSKKSSEWIELKNKQPSQVSYAVKGKIGEAGVFEGEIDIVYGGIDALHRRNHMAGFPSAEEYMDDKIQKFTEFKIKKGTVMNLDDVDKQLAEHLVVSIDFSKHIRNNHFSFNPILINRTTNNPFNLDERTYPVDLGAKRMEIHSVQIELPDGYQIEDAPKNVKLVLPENTAQYAYRTLFENNKL